MVVGLGVAYGLNAWYADELRRATAEFRALDLAWLMGLLPVLAAVIAVGLGWLVLSNGRPDVLVGAIYAVVGLGLVFAYPAWVRGWWTPPGSLLLDLASGLMLPIWLAAGVGAIGIAELLRWTRGRPRGVTGRLQGWEQPPTNLLSR